MLSHQSKFKVAVADLLVIVAGATIPFPVAQGASRAATVIVKLKPGIEQTVLSQYGQVEPLFDRVYRLRLANQELGRRALESSSVAQYVEEEGRLHTKLVPSDPLFVSNPEELTKQWYLSKIQVPQAWEHTLGGGITIAVVDTGIDAKHEDLNDGRVVGGYMSFCQVANQSVPNDCLLRISSDLAPGVNSDDNGHGTIVAGIIGAIANNNKGIAGIDWNVRLMPIKALDSTGTGLTSDVAVGIKWAADHGAKIINLSIGGSGLQGLAVLQDAITYAFNKGVLVVSAAGNDTAVSGTSLDANPILPVCADGGQNMVVGVAAVDSNDRKAAFSNYGSKCVDIAAPGAGVFIDKQQKQGLISTYYDPNRPGEHDLYVYAVGTSMAAPMVSGVAGLMMAAFPDLDVKAIRDRLIGSVDNIDQANQSGCNGNGCVGQLGRGRLNALKAVSVNTTFSSGTLVKLPDGQIFLIERGLKRLVSPYVFNQRFAGTSVMNVAADQLITFPTGSAVAPVDGSIVKEPQNPTVYLIEGGQRRALSYLAFVSRGLRFENVVTFLGADLNEYPQGSDAPVLSGVLMKASDSPAVYILNNGLRQLISYFVFVQRSFLSVPIVVLPPGELAQFPPEPNGTLYPPLEGTLIRGEQVATVYLIEAGKRRGLTLTAFQSRNYRFSDVKVLPQSEVDGYAEVDPIIF